jgi:(p)ppGpp synthase/HD superfamily hydrolase
MDSPLIFHAIQFASAAHTGQYRKNPKVPYLIHPLRVSKILSLGQPDPSPPAAPRATMVFVQSARRPLV